MLAEDGFLSILKIVCRLYWAQVLITGPGAVPQVTISNEHTGTITLSIHRQKPLVTACCSYMKAPAAPGYTNF